MTTLQWLGVVVSYDGVYECTPMGADRSKAESLAADKVAADRQAWLELEQKYAGQDQEHVMSAIAQEQEPSSHTTGAKITGDLERLASLHASGALTDLEFQAAKAKLLGL